MKRVVYDLQEFSQLAGPAISDTHLSFHWKHEKNDVYTSVQARLTTPVHENGREYILVWESEAFAFIDGLHEKQLQEFMEKTKKDVERVLGFLPTGGRWEP
ncbi:MAG: hypothetical protein QW544_03540 [Candidatus Caldarchaeum sp.]